MADSIKSRSLNLSHGFFTRRGGVSSGIYDSLNCGLSNKDDPEAVRENRARVAAALGQKPDSLTTLYQVHGAEVITITEPVIPENRPKADAMVTATRGLVLGVLTADCGPLLLHDPVAGVIGATHSGWKGTLANISTATIKAMQALGAQPHNITAVLGPCIAADSYEVGPDFPSTFINAGYGRFFSPSVKTGHFMFDLKGCIRQQLETAQIGRIEICSEDTYKEDAGFFSNRRALHRGEAGFGLQISAIVLD